MNRQVSHRWILIFLVAGSSLMRSCYLEQVLDDPGEHGKSQVIAFDQVFAFADLKDNLLLYTLPSDTIVAFRPFIQFGDYRSVAIDGMELSPDEINDLGEVTVNHLYTVTARNSTGNHTFQLYFTTLPVIRINTEKAIVDEPKVLSRMDIQYATDVTDDPQTMLFTSYAGIEIRGRTSAQYDKKSYGVELWKDIHGNDCSAPLLGMRNGEDWILDAMYIDPLRMRNRLSFELWEKMWAGRTGSPWKTSCPGILCEYTELFINQRYMGLYCLSERLDETLINLEEGQPGSDGVMYKAISWIGGATAFKTYNSEPPSLMRWEGWEQICPDKRFCWGPLAELRKSVVQDEDELFISKIDTLIDLDCLAEYYLFINLVLAHDNIIKNYFLARYPDGSPFLVMPWDLEGSWGIMWDGDPSSSNGLVDNNLYKRLLELDVADFGDMLESKWEAYRRSVFRLDSLVAPAIRYADQLKRSGAIERENSRWKSAGIDMDPELEYLSDWTARRLEYLDRVFDEPDRSGPDQNSELK